MPTITLKNMNNSEEDEISFEFRIKRMMIRMVNKIKEDINSQMNSKTIQIKKSTIPRRIQINI
jgi:hypothetical protein